MSNLTENSKSGIVYTLVIALQEFFRMNLLSHIIMLGLFIMAGATIFSILNFKDKLDHMQQHVFDLQAELKKETELKKTSSVQYPLIILTTFTVLCGSIIFYKVFFKISKLSNWIKTIFNQISLEKQNNRKALEILKLNLEEHALQLETETIKSARFFKSNYWFWYVILPFWIYYFHIIFPKPVPVPATRNRNN